VLIHNNRPPGRTDGLQTWGADAPALAPTAERSAGPCDCASAARPSFAARIAPLGFQNVEVHVVAHIAARGRLVGLEIPRRVGSAPQRFVDDMAAALARPHGLVKGGEVPARSEAALEVSPDVGMVGEEREVLEFVRISVEIVELRRIGRCRSARGPDADRRPILLIPNGTRGSKSVPSNILGVRTGAQNRPHRCNSAPESNPAMTNRSNALRRRYQFGSRADLQLVDPHRSRVRRQNSCQLRSVPPVAAALTADI